MVLTRLCALAGLGLAVVAGCGSSGSAESTQSATAVDRFNEAAPFVRSALFVTLVENLGCNGAGRMREQAELLDPAGEAAPPLLRVADHLDAAAEVCDIDETRWRTELAATVEALSELERALGGEDAPIDASGLLEAELPELAALITSQYDRLHGLTVDRDPPDSSAFWINPRHLDRVTELRLAAATGQSPTVAAVGNSTIGRALDVEALRAGGLEFMNLAVDGTHPWAHRDIVGEFVAISPGLEHIVWAVDPRFAAGNCTDARVRIDATFEQRSRVLGDRRPVGATDADVLLGTDAALGVRDVPAYDRQMDFDGTVTFGATEPVDYASGEAEQRARDRTRSMVETAQVCRDQIDRIAETITAWTAQGLEVTVLIPPYSPELAAMYPDGGTALEAALDEIGQVAAARGVALLDYRDLVPADEFSDPVHVDAAGRARVTERLLADLS